MPVSDILKSFRGSESESDDGEDEKSATPRTIMLSGEEVKSVGPQKPGADITLEVTGTLEDDGHFHVMSVKGSSTMPDQEMKGMAAQVAGMPDRAMPSPS